MTELLKNKNVDVFWNTVYMWKGPRSSHTKNI